MRTQRPATVLALALLGLALAACTEPTADEPYWGEEGESAAGVLSSPEPTQPPAPGMIALEPEESLADVANPERGFYVGYDLVAGRDASSIRAGGHTLAIALVNLEAYRTSSLPSTLLGSLDRGFDRARTAGIKLIVRFTYNSAFAPDATQARVLGHLGQLGPVLRDNADVIAVVQGGFIGAWGEWHSSTNGLTAPAAREAIIGALLDAVPESRSVQLRKPDFKAAFVDGAVGAGEAFGSSARARLGHHNDCFLASETDLGTYEAPVATWRAYVAADSAYTPMGGETCKVYTPRTSCDAALAEMATNHWTYLNRQYHASVIGGWVDEGCDSTIRRRLGYRFVMRRVAHSERVAPGGVLTVEVDVDNRGFAVPMNERPVDVVLTDGTTRHVARLAVDARRLPAGQVTRIAARLRVPADLAPGTYTLALRLPDAAPSLADDTRYAIQLANTGVWDAETGDNLLDDALVVDATAGGERDPGAARFVALP